MPICDPREISDPRSRTENVRRHVLRQRPGQHVDLVFASGAVVLLHEFVVLVLAHSVKRVCVGVRVVAGELVRATLAGVEPAVEEVAVAQEIHASFVRDDNHRGAVFDELGQGDCREDVFAVACV